MLLYIKHKNFVFRAEFPMGIPNISSFLTFPYPLDCLICAKEIMIIVLLLHMIGGWEGWGVVH